MKVDIFYLQSAIRQLPTPTQSKQRHILNVPDFLSSNKQEIASNLTFDYHPVVCVAELYMINGTRTLRWELEL